MIKKLVELALHEVGVHEEGGNNCGARIREYQRSTWLEPGPWPWCAAFTCWLLQEAGYDERTRCKDASAFGWEKWGRQKGATIVPKTGPAKEGDFVIFDFSHIGLVISDQIPGSLTIQTVEGNANREGERDGDGVWKKERSVALVKCYVRLPA